MDKNRRKAKNLPYKQRVGGSNPSTPTFQRPLAKFTCKWFFHFHHYRSFIASKTEFNGDTGIKRTQQAGIPTNAHHLFFIASN